MRVLGRRDAFGQRPLYWAAKPTAVITASFLAELRMQVGVASEIDPEGAADALAGVLRPTRSLLRDVFRVPPGHELVADEEAVRCAPWWEPPLSGDGEPLQGDAAMLLAL